MDWMWKAVVNATPRFLKSHIEDVMHHWEIRSKADPNRTTIAFKMGGIASADAGGVG